MKTVLLKVKKELHKEDTLAAVVCTILSISIFVIMKILSFEGRF
ncbi:hypothetical protein [uncultured Maribacter sp.]|nr:hypothetical protein [uncultured Maribacter sp.]